MVAFEIERIDVLIFLGRVLRILHTAIGPHLEPLFVRFHIGMVWRTLERQVQRDFQSKVFGFGLQAFEICKRTQLREYGIVSAFFRANGPRAADIVRRSLLPVVLAFAVDPADGMYRRKIENVEAHFRDVGQPLLAIAKRTMASRFVAA